ncbi:MAG TPA: DUF2939 domain-containing protein [Candidatus Binataceae bacterium]|nr:DUF2939 domain-containing protein [Candidatus Binataceae bacterium]
MGRFLLRHWTGVLLVIVVAAWAVFYLPQTPTFAVLQLKLAIDARDGDRAAEFVDFQSLVRSAGMQMVENQRGSGDPLADFISKGAVQLFSGPAANLVQSWAKQKVDDGAREVQMPAAAVAGAVILLHHSGDSAYTHFRDRKGQVWDIRMARNPDGQWQVVEVKNIQQLLERLEKHERERFGTN